MVRGALIFLLLFFVLSLGAHAQDVSFERIYKMTTSEAAQELIQLSLSKIHLAECEAKQRCAPATKREYEKPPITEDDARSAMTFGVQGALAEWCGHDWKRVLLPMIVFGKDRKKMSDRQLQLMTLVFADFKARQLKFYSSKAACPKAFAERLDAELPKLKR